MTFSLKSASFAQGDVLPHAQVFNGMGQTGENLSPELSWSGAPAGTKSFALMVFDPDAPTGSGWWHWVVINIDATVTSLPVGAGSAKAELPAGALQTRTDFGAPGYGGAAPPPGPSHRYIFTVFALDAEKLDLDEHASGAMVGYFVRSHALASASLTAVYPAP